MPVIYLLLRVCRHLSTFRIARYGEGRALTRQKVEDMYIALHKSDLFRPLPPTLSDYECWMPAFNLFPYSHENAGVKVIFRAKADASPTDVEQWRESQSNLP